MRFGLGLGLAVAHFSSPGLEDGETGSATMTETFTMTIAGTEAGETGSQTDAEVFTMSIASTEADEVGASGAITPTMAIAATEANETGSATETEVFTMTVASTEAAETATATMTAALADPIPGFTNLKLYLNTQLAAPHVSSGSNIDSWADQSGVGNSLNLIPTGCSAPQRVTVGSDLGLQCVAGSKHALIRAAANLIGTGAFTIGYVMKWDATINQGIFWADTDLSGAGGFGTVLKQASGSWDYEFYGVGLNTDGAISTTGYHVGIWDRASASAPIFYYDGASQSLSPSQTTDPIAAGVGVFSGMGFGTWGNFDSNHGSFTVLAFFATVGTSIGATNAAAAQAYLKQQFGTP